MAPSRSIKLPNSQVEERYVAFQAQNSTQKEQPLEYLHFKSMQEEAQIQENLMRPQKMQANQSLQRKRLSDLEEEKHPLN